MARASATSKLSISTNQCPESLHKLLPHDPVDVIAWILLHTKVRELSLLAELLEGPLPRILWVWHEVLSLLPSSFDVQEICKRESERRVLDELIDGSNEVSDVAFALFRSKCAGLNFTQAGRTRS